MTARTWILIAAGVFSAAPLTPQDADQGLAIEIKLEQYKTDHWDPVDNKTVFHNDDEIRFRFRSSMSGFLYVLNRTSGGHNMWLFPRPGQGQASRVEAGPDYLIPGTKGSFAVGGPPGFDVTYWVLSPIAIEPSLTAEPALGSQPSTLVPRCRTEELQARGLCTDERAGPRAAKRGDDTPLTLPSSQQPLVARDLQFHNDEGGTRITAPKVRDGIVVYEFHVAHQ